MEHTRFLLLTRSTFVEGCCSRIEKEARKIAECTSYTPCVTVLLSFCVWTISTLSLSSFPTHVFPVLSVRKRLWFLCVPLKFHNLPSCGNISRVSLEKLARPEHSKQIQVRKENYQMNTCRRRYHIETDTARKHKTIRSHNKLYICRRL